MDTRLKKTAMKAANGISQPQEVEYTRGGRQEVEYPRSATQPSTPKEVEYTRGGQQQIPKAAQQAVNPSGITQSFYNPHSTATNYDGNRPTYQQSQAVTAAGNALAQHEGNKPTAYQSQYGDQIQSMIDSILNRGKFSYDFAADPMYQQYAQQYQRNAQLGMRDTMAQTAALTGGYGNSYAQHAGQQTYQGVMEGLNDMIPELQQAAYQMYRDEGTDLLNKLGVLQGADDSAYGRYRDTVGDYQNELNYLFGKYSGMSQQEYERYLNDAAAWESDRAYWYQRMLDNPTGSSGGSSSSGSQSSSAANAGAAGSAIGNAVANFAQWLAQNAGTQNSGANTQNPIHQTAPNSNVFNQLRDVDRRRKK